MTRDASLEETDNLTEGAGSLRWLYLTLLACALIFGTLRGYYGLVLVAVCVVLGTLLGSALSKTFRNRRTLLVLAVALGAGSATVAVLGLLGRLSFTRVEETGLWLPAAALLLAPSLKLLVERERSKDADKLRMMLDLYPHPDGGRWTAEKMERATEGELDARTFEDLLQARGKLVGSLGLSPVQDAALARAMDFPYELWTRNIEWWEALHGDWRRGEDVADRLHEWDCVTPERAAERLELSTADIMRMVEDDELEARQGRDGEWQIREHDVFEAEFLKEGRDPDVLPSIPRHSANGRTGTANHLDRFGKPF